MRRSRHHHPLNPGRGAAHPAAPFRLAALATHPREGGGQVTWRRRTLPSNPAYPILWGKGDHALQTCLPPLVGGEGDHEVVEGGRRRRHYKKTAAKPPPSPSARRAVKLKNLTNPRGKAPSTLTPDRACPMRADYLANPSFSWRSPCSSVFRGQARLKRRKPSPSSPKTYPMSSHRWQS